MLSKNLNVKLLIQDSGMENVLVVNVNQGNAFVIIVEEDVLIKPIKLTGHVVKMNFLILNVHYNKILNLRMRIYRKLLLGKKIKI